VGREALLAGDNFRSQDRIAHPKLGRERATNANAQNTPPALCEGVFQPPFEQRRMAAADDGQDVGASD